MARRATGRATSRVMKAAPATSVTRLATAVVALQVALFISLGLPDGALGVAWPSMRGAVGQPLGSLGVVLALGTIGYLTGSPSVASLARRFGTPRTMTVSVAMSALAIGSWAATRSWLLLLAASFLLGVARGMIDAGLNSYVALHGGVRRLGLLHGSYGVGTSIGSLLVVASLATGTWRSAWVVMAVVDVAVVSWAWRQRDAWPPDVVVDAPDADDDEGAAPARPALVIAVTMLCFAALVGAEYSTGVWSYTLLTDGRGMSDTAAGLWVAAYWVGLTVARFGLGAFGDRVGRVTLLNASCAVALAGVVLLWWDPLGLGPLGVPIAGLGFANIFPTLVALMPDRMGAHRSSAVIGWSVAAASLGGTGVAAGAGVLVDRQGASSLGPTLVVVTVALAVLHLVLVKLAPV
jgi:fucose permease